MPDNMMRLGKAESGDRIQPFAEPRPQPTGTLALLERALELKLSAADLAAWMDLHERSEAVKAKAAYAAAMSRAQAEMPAVIRDAENTHTKKMYARLEAVADVIKPVYTKHGFAISFDNEKSDLANFFRVRADVTHEAGHKEQYRLELPLDKSGVMNTIQGAGSTQTYARRYLTLNIFNVVVKDQDNDGNDPTAIGPGQIEVLNDLIERTNTDLGRFLAWAKIEALNQMRVGDFEKARQMLTVKAKQNGSKS